MYIRMCVLTGLISSMLVNAVIAEGESVVKFSLDAKAEYTDNRDSTAKKDSNTDYYLKPTINLQAKGERLTLDGYYTPAYRYRSDPNPLQNEDELLQDLGIKVDGKLSSRFGFDMSEWFTYTDDPAIKEGGTRVRPNATYYFNKLELGVSTAPKPLTTIDVRGTHSIKRYKEDEVARESDEDRLAGSITLIHQIAPTMGFVVFGGYADYGYETGSRNILRDVSAFTGGIGLENIFSPELRGGIRFGYSKADFEDSRLGSTTAPYADISARISPKPDTALSLGITHMLRNSDVYPFASQENTEASSKIEIQSSERLMFSILVVYRIGKYEQDMLPPEGTDIPLRQSGDDKLFLTTAQINVRLTDKASLTFSYSYEDVSSDVDESYSKNTVSIAFSKGL